MNSKLKIVFITIIALAVGLSFYLRQSGGAGDAASDFLEQMQANELESAYDNLSTSMQAVASAEALAAFIETNRLATSEASEWDVLNSNAAREILATTLTSPEGPERHLATVFSRGPEGWKLDAMLMPQNLDADKLRAVTPETSEILNLVSDSVQQFALSLKAGNMQRFHNTISKLWRDQASRTDLEQAFKPFFNAGIDLTVLIEVTPVIDNIPVQDKSGVISITGYFPTRPSKLSFEQKFIWEGLAWKLVGFTANIN